MRGACAAHGIGLAGNWVKWRASPGGVGGGGGGRVPSTTEEHGPLDRAGGAGDRGQLGHRGGRR